MLTLSLLPDLRRIVNVWNSADEVDFNAVQSFTRTIKRVSLTNLLAIFNVT